MRINLSRKLIKTYRPTADILSEESRRYIFTLHHGNRTVIFINPLSGLEKRKECNGKRIGRQSFRSSHNCFFKSIILFTTDMLL